MDLLRGPLEIICELVRDENGFENPIVVVARRLLRFYREQSLLRTRFVVCFFLVFFFLN